MSFSEIRDKDAKYVEDTNNGWLAMVQHHFVSAWVPPQGEVRHNYTRALGHDLFAVGTLISLKEIAPGATQTNHAVLYSGPQEQARLEQLAPGLELVVGSRSLLSPFIGFWISSMELSETGGGPSYF